MRRHAPISRIYQMGRSAPPSGEEQERRSREMRKTAWHAHGLIILDPEDITDDWLRQAMINEADARYGRRGRQGQHGQVHRRRARSDRRL